MDVEHEPGAPEGVAAPAPGELAAPPPVVDPRGPRPRFAVDDDLRRSRLLALFRLPLTAPHLVWISLWGLVVAVALPAIWLVALATGRLPRPLHRFLRAFTRYATQLFAFASLAGNPFPGFLGSLPYPIDVDVPEPVRQPRLGLLLRWLLIVPAVIFCQVLGVVGWLLVPVAWLVAVALGRLPRGLAEVLQYVVRFHALTLAYGMLLTRRYPTLGGDAR